LPSVILLRLQHYGELVPGDDDELVPGDDGELVPGGDVELVSGVGGELGPVVDGVPVAGGRL
jgi:hypothetical protein